MPESVDPTRLRLTNQEGTQGVLLGTHCRDCDAYVFGGAVFCQSCSSSDLEPVELASKGTLYSFTVVRVPASGWLGPVPYILGQVELPEGPQVLAEVVDCPLDSADSGDPIEDKLKIGMDVELVLRVVSPEDAAEKSVYKWRPA